MVLLKVQLRLKERVVIGKNGTIQGIIVLQFS
jgi:hypothetical protein